MDRKNKKNGPKKKKQQLNKQKKKPITFLSISSVLFNY